MSQLSVMLQERARREREARTVLEILREQMDDADGGRGGERRSLKQRLRLNGIGCCGATWAFRRTAAISLNEEDEDPPRQQHPPPLPPPQQQEVINVGQAAQGNDWDPGCVGPILTGSGMNLAAALAAERQFRAPQDPDVGGPVGPTSVPGTPLRVSLMRLLEETETDSGDASAVGAGTVAAAESENVEGAMGNDSVCCVCMGRKKGAAFIPCGHTFCRVCSREVWLNRGSCPLCNRSILEILDIF